MHKIAQENMREKINDFDKDLEEVKNKFKTVTNSFNERIVNFTRSLQAI